MKVFIKIHIFWHLQIWSVGQWSCSTRYWNWFESFSPLLSGKIPYPIPLILFWLTKWILIAHLLQTVFWLFLEGSESTTDKASFVEPAILSKSPVYLLRPHCLASLNVKSPIAFGRSNIQKCEALFTFISYEIYGHSCVKLNRLLCIILLDIDCVKKCVCVACKLLSNQQWTA